MEYSRPLESSLPPQALADLVLRVERQYTDHSSIINERFETSPAILSYTEQLTKILNQAPATDAWQAIYRAFHFAVEINRMAGLRPLTLRAAVDFPVGQSAEEICEQIIAKSNDYMERTPALDVVTGRFMPELDPTGRYVHLVDTVVGLTSLQLERGYQEKIAAQTIEQWDGTLNGIDDPRP